jgi:hypothetical protein
MLEVAEGVFEIGILFVHAHLVVVDDGVVLVAVFGHGPAVRGHAVDRFKELAAA